MREPMTFIKTGEGTSIAVPVRVVNDWNNNTMMAAALLKTGQGKIVRKNGKRYTEVIS